VSVFVLFMFLKGSVCQYPMAKTDNPNRRRFAMKTMTFLILPVMVPLMAFASPALALPSPDAGRGETRADRLAMVKPHFAVLDANRDGFVTKDEVLALRDRQAADRLDQRFQTIDSNRDGAISRSEFSGNRNRGKSGFAQARNRGNTPYFGTRMFTAADINRDGKMTEAEMANNVQAWFDRTDTDHDGVLTTEERKAARERNRTGRGAKRGEL
jgi:Ca2+-binding EF-hand superfamily protein